MTMTSEGLARVVRTVWSTQLGLEAEPDDSARIEPPAGVLTAVRFRGGFEGTLTQCCSTRLSELAAAAAFSAPARAIGPGEALDTLAELAHVIAGNLKLLLPAPCEVSRPVAGSDQEPPGPVVAEAGFRIDGEPLTVRLARAGGR